jgi:MFS family permease
MMLQPGLRRFVLFAHIVSSVGSLGAVAAFLALAAVGLSSDESPTIRGVYIGMGVTARYVIVPFVLAALLTGLVQSLGTAWGLFKHYWVLAKLLLTLFVAIVLLLQLDGIKYMATEAVERTPLRPEFLGLKQSFLIHAIGGLVVLVLTTVLSVYKPRGMTRHGWRSTHERQGG